MSRDISLSSARLLYKPVSTAHLSAAYLGWLNDEEVIRYLEITAPYTEAQLHKYLSAAEQDDQLYFWAVHIKENDKHIGNIKIDPVNHRHGFAEYGIMMGDKPEWGKGYGTEASQSIIDFCFNELHLRKITLGVVEDNIAGVKLYNKLGFEVEGVLKEQGYYNNKLSNMIRMARFNPARTR